MDPISVLRTLWARRLVSIPIILLTLVACVWALFFGPRSYAATASYVLITPGIPTETEVRENPGLAREADNPYLRSDPALVGQVVAGRLRSASVVETLEGQGLSDDFTVGPGLAGAQQILTVEANGGSPEIVLATLQALGSQVESELVDIQTVDGATARFLISAQTISFPDTATERVSSRLRTVIVLGIGGFVILFGAMSVAQAVDRRERHDPSRNGVASNGRGNAARFSTARS